jgi:hypothetical protein
MSFAMNPGYTNTTLSRRRARSWGQRQHVSRSQPTLSRGQSAPLLLAQALHKCAAARSRLPLRTRRECAPTPNAGFCSLGTMRKLAAPTASLRSASVMPAVRTADLSCADSAQGDRERSTAKSMRMVLARRPNPASSRAATAPTALSDNMGHTGGCAALTACSTVAHHGRRLTQSGPCRG